MSTWDEKAAKAAVESRHAIYDEDFWGYSDQSDAQDDGFENGARWQREALLTDDVIERAARALFYGDIDPELEVTWGTAHESVRAEYLAMARNALAAAIGEDESNE